MRLDFDQPDGKEKAARAEEDSNTFVALILRRAVHGPGCKPKICQPEQAGFERHLGARQDKD